MCEIKSETQNENIYGIAPNKGDQMIRDKRGNGKKKVQ
jgi:hypothetical protein